MKDKYKRCPFCGGEAKMRGANSGIYWMQCQLCGATTRGTLTAQEALALWERRHEGLQRDEPGHDL